MNNAMEVVWAVVGTAGTALIGWLVGLLTKWLTSKMKDKKLASIIASIMDLVKVVVQKTYQVYVETLKENGHFGLDEQHAAKAAALAEIERQLTFEQREYILSISRSVEEWLTLQIEATIYQLKNA